MLPEAKRLWNCIYIQQMRKLPTASTAVRLLEQVIACKARVNFELLFPSCSTGFTV